MRIHLTEISKFAEKVLLPAMYSLRKDEEGVGGKGRISIFLPSIGWAWGWSTLLLLQDSGDAREKGGLPENPAFWMSQKRHLMFGEIGSGKSFLH
ncbi:hypothetical protein CDAR_597181 [Caerostris darwini]|uniref:Uncharacterized protein n=1 Tax=Caerostris darwini TaxID=1538125 RepID=A0AAV4U2I7_9ARAC|nr:hypothetical protein CDAR_597181 [Caerostris darwini]